MCVRESHTVINRECVRAIEALCRVDSSELGILCWSVFGVCEIDKTETSRQCELCVLYHLV